MRRLSRSIEEYLEASGWSSRLFLEHAKAIFNDPRLKRSCTFEVGRSVIYLRSRGTLLKVYVHHGGRSREFITFKNESGDEVGSFHHSTPVESIVLFILKSFQGS